MATSTQGLSPYIHIQFMPSEPICRLSFIFTVLEFENSCPSVGCQNQNNLPPQMCNSHCNSILQEQRVETIVVGDIVAAPYQDHGTWNRARVLGVLASGLVDLYYVDFGDNGELPRDSLCRMR